MSAKITLHIPEPCHQNWQSMTPTEQGKFCDSCQKQVVDFSSMSDRQLVEFFTKNNKSVCGRFQSDQLDRVVAQPKKSLPWIKYVFQIALPAFLLTLKSGAQSGWTKGVTTICTTIKGETLLVIDHEPIIEKDSIKGKVVDADGNAIAYATIMVKGTKIGVATDGQGKFSLDKYYFFKKPLLISAVGFQTKEVTINTDSSNVVLLNTDSFLSGEVVVYHKTKKQKPIPLMEMKTPKAAGNLSVYPNPVQAGGNITINWRNFITGDYLLTIATTGGQQVISEEFQVGNKTGSKSVMLPNVPTGIYSIKTTAKATGKSEALMIAIQ